MEALRKLEQYLAVLPNRFRAISPDAAATQPSSGWSVKQELGHLVDSAANNHQRIVRTQLEDAPSMPEYDGDRWVALQNYQARSWDELITLWEGFNRHLLAAAKAVPEQGWMRTCTVGASGPLTLKFIVDDYITHMNGHLRHMKMDLQDLS
jgi:hypothetical protein